MNLLINQSILSKIEKINVSSLDSRIIEKKVGNEGFQNIEQQQSPFIRPLTYARGKKMLCSLFTVWYGKIRVPIRKERDGG